MPLYEYACRKCGRHIEKIQKFSDAPLTTCEKCGGKLERLISSPAIQFKGSGWYVTDYGRPTSSASKDAVADVTKTSGKSDSSAKKPPESTKPAETVKSSAAKP